MIDPIQAFMQANALTAQAFIPDSSYWETGRRSEGIIRGPGRFQRSKLQSMQER
jgi:hypothetical protein